MWAAKRDDAGLQMRATSPCKGIGPGRGRQRDIVGSQAPRENDMSKRPEQISFFHEAFDPHEIEILDVVFENVRAAIGEPLNDPAVRELVAARLFNFAMRGERDPAKLYRRIVESYQAAPLTNYVTVAPGIVPD